MGTSELPALFERISSGDYTCENPFLLARAPGLIHLIRASTKLEVSWIAERLGIQKAEPGMFMPLPGNMICPEPALWIEYDFENVAAGVFIFAPSLQVTAIGAMSVGDEQVRFPFYTGSYSLSTSGEMADMNIVPASPAPDTASLNDFYKLINLTLRPLLAGMMSTRNFGWPENSTGKTILFTPKDSR